MLDLAQVSQQIALWPLKIIGLGRSAKRLDLALRQLHLESGRLEAFTTSLPEAKPPGCWPVSTSLRTHLCPAQSAAAVTVVATDGSQIAPSHHEVIPAFLLNISTVVLHYGTGERAELSSAPTLFYRDEDLYIDYGGQRVQVTGELLGMRRTIMEFQCLLHRPASHSSGHPRVPFQTAA